MPDRQRLAFSLWFGGGGPNMPYRQVAAIMGVTPKAAYFLVRKAQAWKKAHGQSPADLGEKA